MWRIGRFKRYSRAMLDIASQQNRTPTKASVRVRAPGEHGNSAGVIHRVIGPADDAEGGDIGRDLTKLTRAKPRRIDFGESGAASASRQRG